MANSGIGYRRVWDVMIEISLHLLQPFVFTTLADPVLAGNAVVAQVPTTANMYAGAQLVIDTGVNQEIVTVISIGTTSSPPGPEFTANFTLPHAAGVMVAAATFPLQAVTDPLYTQSEIALYLARAQNQFLLDVPCIFQITHQSVAIGKILQATPSNAIEIEHIASSSLDVPITSASRVSNVVTVTTQSPHGLTPGSAFSLFGSGTAFGGDGAFVAITASGSTITYTQIAADASTSTGSIVIWTRLYETTQQELSMSQGSSWRNQFLTALNSWFEDRTGLYQWGVGGKPAAGFHIEMISSMRDTDTLALTDGFLVPDICLHGVKYLALSYCWSKEGEARNTAMAQLCKMRYDRIVLAVKRWMSAAGLMEPPGEPIVGAGGRKT